MCADRLNVVLCWHMHQPEYRDFTSNVYQQPWTYLHAIKDYVDMAAHLEAQPAARAVVNFAPLLLAQIQDYSAQVQAHFAVGAPIRDPLLAALAAPRLPRGRQQRLALVEAARRANRERLVERFPAYRRLCDLTDELSGKPGPGAYISDTFLTDLLVWYHLVWLGETVRRSNSLVADLINKAHGFTLDDRARLLGLIGELMASVVPRYKHLAQQGRIELSTSPWGHPILPLLIDVNSATAALPNLTLPACTRYPAGEERARWHLSAGLRVFEEHFGFTPAGCWPSEGAVCDSTLRLLGDYGMKWTASGETVLKNSLGAAMDASALHRPYRLTGTNTLCFFRNDELSDDIGFNFSRWHADDAVAHLIRHLEHIRRECHRPHERVVAIILDGENAWEFFPENGYHFLSALYERLSAHPDINLTTFSALAKAPLPAPALEHIVPGSWVYGTLSTWIGHQAKNRAWDYLAWAAEAFEANRSRMSEEQAALARRQLGVCEASDWFWWLGDENPQNAVETFDQLFRRQLQDFYRLLRETPPRFLDTPIATGSRESVERGTMRPGLKPIP